MTVRKNRAGHWFVDRYIDGRRVRRVIPEARTKSEALRAESAFVNEQFTRRYDPEVKRVLFTDYVSRSYLPHAKAHKDSKGVYNDELNCRLFCDRFKGKYLDEITTAMIEDFKRYLLATPSQHGKLRQPPTVKRILNTLRRVFSLAVNAGLIVENPCSRLAPLKDNAPRVRYLTADEEKRLLAALAADDFHRRVVLVTLYTGMRRGEVYSLKWRDVDFDRSLIHVRKSKTNQPRAVPLAEIVRGALEDARAAGVERDALIFPRAIGEGKTAQWNFRRLNHAWRNALKLAGIEDFHFHDLRHSAGTRLADAGVNPVVIADILGHRNLRTTQRYCHALEDAKREAMKRLAGYAARAVNAGEDAKA